MLIFIHRLFFFLGRAIALVGVPLAVLIMGGMLHDEGNSITGWLGLFLGIFAALAPLLLVKYVIRVSCPNCGGKLDREMIGAGNYDCEECGNSYS